MTLVLCVAYVDKHPGTVIRFALCFEPVCNVGGHGPVSIAVAL